MRRKEVNEKAKTAVWWLAEHWVEVIVISITIFCLTAVIAGVFIEANKPREGIVTSKEYRPAYESVTNRNTYDAQGRITGSYPVTRYHGEQYIITIKGTGRNGKEAYGSYYVTPKEYERIQIGDYYRSGQ